MIDPDMFKLDPRESPLMRELLKWGKKMDHVDPVYDMFRPPARIGKWIIIGESERGATILRREDGTILEMYLN